MNRSLKILTKIYKMSILTCIKCPLVEGYPLKLHLEITNKDHLLLLFNKLLKCSQLKIVNSKIPLKIRLPNE